MPEEVSPTHTEAVSFSGAVTLILGVSPLLCWCIVSFAVPRWALMRNGSLSARKGWGKTCSLLLSFH